jgi:hypothetical protein
MYSAHSRPAHVRRPLFVLILALSVMVVASLASATSAFAWSNQLCIALDPATANNQLPEDSTHTVTATVTERAGYGGDDPAKYCNDPEVTYTPKAGVQVFFYITDGPNANLSGNGVTDANGHATFSWSSSVAGTDSISAWLEVAGYEQDGTPVDWVKPTAYAVKNWLPPIVPPNPPVTPAGVPDTTLVVSKKCQSKKFKISSSHSNGTVTKYVLQVDGKTIKTVTPSTSDTATKTFTIDSGKYDAGSHSIKLTTTFSNGSKVVKNGTFKRCAVRTTARRISPNFTG